MNAANEAALTFGQSKKHMLEELRAATRSHHIALEDALPLMRPGLTRATYKTVLLGFLGVYAPAEAAVARYDGALREIGIDVTTRRKRALLESDLSALGADAETIATARASGPTLTIHSVAEALGALYVMEGATLGGQLISRRVHATLGLTPTTGGAFFSAYGRSAGSMWRSFLAALQAPGAPHDARAVHDASQAACALFMAFLQAAHACTAGPDGNAPRSAPPESSRE